MTSLRPRRKNNVRSTTKDEESPNTGHFWMNLIATKNEYRSRNFSKARITQKISKKRLCFFSRSTFRIWRIHLSCRVKSSCVQLVFPLQINESQPFNTAFLVESNFSLYFSSVLRLFVWDFTFLGTSHSCDAMTRAATTLTSMFELKLRKLDVINVLIFVTRELWTQARAPKQASDFSKHYSRFYSHNLKYCKIFSNTNFYPLLG